MSLPAFLRDATSLASHLQTHHGIEEHHIFPILARKMPQFAAPPGGKHSHSNKKIDSSSHSTTKIPSSPAPGSHLLQHEAIHHGLDQYSALLFKYQKDNTSFNPKELRDCMDSFREALFVHLDEEVESLSGESMRAAGWTLDEIRRIPM